MQDSKKMNFFSVGYAIRKNLNAKMSTGKPLESLLLAAMIYACFGLLECLFLLVFFLFPFGSYFKVT